MVAANSQWKGIKRLEYSIAITRWITPHRCFWGKMMPEKSYMKKFLDRLFELDEEKSIWVEEKDLGNEISIVHRDGRYQVKIPKTINQKITLRLKGLGKTRRDRTGDLYLHVWLNKGKDVGRVFWISEHTARDGAQVSLSLDDKKITMVIPPKSHHGLTLRLKGLGAETKIDDRAPALHHKSRGDLLVKLFVYPEKITPVYGYFDMLSTDDMALEGWIYKTIDEITQQISASAFPAKPLQASTVADIYNERGWEGIFSALVDHLKLGRLDIKLSVSESISSPGRCQKTVTPQKDSTYLKDYSITISTTFLDNPFSVAAIMAHELCHVIYFENIDPWRNVVGFAPDLKEKETLEMEHTVDLLVFMFKIGEFQLRAARDKRFSLGYFHQELFERMQVIVARKLNAQ